MPEIELRQVALFSEMDEHEVGEIRAIMGVKKFKTGETVVREGETGDLFYVVTEGQAQVTIVDAAGEEIVLHEVGPGGFFGELSMLTREPRSARVKAISDLTTLALQREDFFRFLHKRPSAAIDVLIELGGRLHAMDGVLRKMASRNVNVLEEERLTAGQRIADFVADTMGSWTFIVIQSTILTIWIALNVTAWIKNWDPYPFILLNLMLSFQAAYAAPFIMMSQNRQAAKDRLSADVDHRVNTKAELEIGLLTTRLDDLSRVVSENQQELKEMLTQH
jgi:CRP/FNR family cyclic AMP-dependent transcriptional regulator